MRLLVELAGSQRRPVLCIDIHESTSLTVLREAALRAVLPTSSSATLLGHGVSASSFRLLHNGRPLGAKGSLASSLKHLGFTDRDVIQVVPTLRGGGGDGGSTCAESRSCYLEMYAQRKPAKVDPKDTVFARWTNCLLSAEPLSPPCVVDKLGNILNKEAVIRALQSKSMPGALRHIRGLRDVTDVKLTEIPSVEDSALVRFQCPISGLEFNGSFRFFFMRCCGHALSQRALKQLRAHGCPMCHADQAKAERIPINGTKEEVEELRKRMDEERDLAKAEKAEKKKGSAGSNLASAVDIVATPGPTASAEVSKKDADGGKANVALKKVGALVNDHIRGPTQENDTVASKSLNDGQAVSGKKHGQAQKGAQAKRFKAGDHAPSGATKEVYASIFTSSRKTEFKETYSCRSLPLGRN